LQETLLQWVAMLLLMQEQPQRAGELVREAVADVKAYIVDLAAVDAELGADLSAETERLGQVSF